MKRFVIIAAVLACFTILTAQTPAPPSGPALTAEQQKALKDAVAVSSQADSELQAAQARAELARQRFFTMLYNVMAERGIKPSEYSWKITDQGVAFEPIAKAKPNEDIKKP
jgi:hypothetical protein